MSNEKMREEFESWVTSIGREVTRYDDGACEYACLDTDSDWLAWQASREALVIELPEPYAVIGDYAACGGSRAVWSREFAEKIDDRMCEKTAVYDRAGLEAAGVKVKP